MAVGETTPCTVPGRGRVSDEFAQELARMALVLHEQADVEQTAEKFLEYVLAKIGSGHASVVLVQRGGRLESVAATDALVEEADRLQVETGEGPTFSAIEQAASVVSGDVASGARRASSSAIPAHLAWTVACAYSRKRFKVVRSSH